MVRWIQLPSASASATACTAKAAAIVKTTTSHSGFDAIQGWNAARSTAFLMQTEHVRAMIHLPWECARAAYYAGAAVARLPLFEEIVIGGGHVGTVGESKHGATDRLIVPTRCFRA
jgi:hypothetical protein